MNKDDREMLIQIKAKVDFIYDNMAHRSSISLLKWSMGGVGCLALAALLLAAKAAVI